MLSNIQKIIMVKALTIRKKQGEFPQIAIQEYKKLTDEDKAEILERIRGDK